MGTQPPLDGHKTHKLSSPRICPSSKDPKQLPIGEHVAVLLGMMTSITRLKFFEAIRDHGKPCREEGNQEWQNRMR